MGFFGLQLNEWSNVATIVSLFVGASVMKLSGFRVGPIRAMAVALRSATQRVEEKSVRTTEMSALKELMRQASNKTSYIVVQGPKGVGKSCMIDTCLAKTMGVLRVTVCPGTLQKEIVNDCYHKIVGGLNLSFIPQETNVARVLFWHKLLFRRGPTMVLSMSERPRNVEPAEVTGAVRELTGMGVVMVVDASPNSLPPDLLTTKRQLVLRVEGMSNENIRSLPQLQTLFKVLDDANLSEVVLSMLGGIPAAFIRLSIALASGRDTHNVVSVFLCEKVNDALVQCQMMSTREPKFKKIFALFKDGVSHVKAVELEKEGLELPSPCKVLRLPNMLHLEPIDPIVAFVFRHECNAEEALNAMDKLVREAKR